MPETTDHDTAGDVAGEPSFAHVSAGMSSKHMGPLAGWTLIAAYLLTSMGIDTSPTSFFYLALFSLGVAGIARLLLSASNPPQCHLEADTMRWHGYWPASTKEVAVSSITDALIQKKIGWLTFDFQSSESLKLRTDANTFVYVPAESIGGDSKEIIAVLRQRLPQCNILKSGNALDRKAIAARFGKHR